MQAFPILVFNFGSMRWKVQCLWKTMNLAGLDIKLPVSMRTRISSISTSRWFQWPWFVHGLVCYFVVNHPGIFKVFMPRRHISTDTVCLPFFDGPINAFRSDLDQFLTIFSWKMTSLNSIHEKQSLGYNPKSMLDLRRLCCSHGESAPVSQAHFTFHMFANVVIPADESASSLPRPEDPTKRNSRHTTWL